MNCKHCGSEFKPTGRNQKYCSKKCQIAVSNKKRIDKRCEERGRARMVGICRTCGADFKKKNRADAFCSDQCRQQGKSNVTPYKDQYRLRRYNLSEEQYKALTARAGGQCEICGVAEVQAPKGRLHIDHDHSTGKVRGLLCQRCNHGLGLFQDRVALLNRASEYLSRNLSNKN